MSNVERRIYAAISFIMLLVIGSGIITYTPRISNLYVRDKTKKHWATIKEIANLEQGYEIIIWYHNGTIEASEIAFSDNSTTLIGYEKVYFQYYVSTRGNTIIDDHYDGFNANIGLLRRLLSRLARGGN